MSKAIIKKFTQKTTRLIVFIHYFLDLTQLLKFQCPQDKNSSIWFLSLQQTNNLMYFRLKITQHYIYKMKKSDFPFTFRLNQNKHDFQKQLQQKLISLSPVSQKNSNKFEQEYEKLNFQQNQAKTRSYQLNEKRGQSEQRINLVSHPDTIAFIKRFKTQNIKLKQFVRTAIAFVQFQRNKDVQTLFTRKIKQLFITKDKEFISLDALQILTKKVGISSLLSKEYYKILIKHKEQSLMKANQAIVQQFQQIKKDFDLKQKQIEQNQRQLLSKQRQLKNRQKRMKQILLQQYNRNSKRIQEIYISKLVQIQKKQAQFEKKIRNKIKTQLGISTQKIKKIQFLQKQNDKLKQTSKSLTNYNQTIKSKLAHSQSQSQKYKQLQNDLQKNVSSLKEQINILKQKLSNSSKTIKQNEYQIKRFQIMKEEHLKIKKQLQTKKKTQQQLKSFIQNTKCVQDKKDKQPQQSPLVNLIHSLKDILQLSIPCFINFHLNQNQPLQSLDLGQLLFPQSPKILPLLIQALIQVKSEGILQLVGDLILFKYFYFSKVSKKEPQALLNIKLNLKKSLKINEQPLYKLFQNLQMQSSFCYFLSEQLKGKLKPVNDLLRQIICVLLGLQKQLNEKACDKILNILKKQESDQIKYFFYRTRSIPILLSKMKNPNQISISNSILLLTCQSKYRHPFLKLLAQNLNNIIDLLDCQKQQGKCNGVVLVQRMIQCGMGLEQRHKILQRLQRIQISQDNKAFIQNNISFIKENLNELK